MFTDDCNQILKMAIEGRETHDATGQLLPAKGQVRYRVLFGFVLFVFLLPSFFSFVGDLGKARSEVSLMSWKAS